MMLSSFDPSDCIYLLKDLTGIIPFTPKELKEKMIADGHNYSEMITPEEPLPIQVDSIFREILDKNLDNLAFYVGVVSEEIRRRFGKKTIIASLARAGSPIGALVHRYLKFKYHEDVPHYSLSIIRGKGIDENALDFILSMHPSGKIVFIDGWTGKGSIRKELHKTLTVYNRKHSSQISDTLAVLADPAHVASFAGTLSDVCIPNACLNSTISGLISRTILNEKYIDDGDFHGAVRYDQYKSIDVTNEFLDAVSSRFTNADKPKSPKVNDCSVAETINMIEKDFHVSDVNKIKLSIGESSRALIRRIPRLMLVKHPDNPDLEFVLYMAHHKGVAVKEYDTRNYECITLLK